MAASLSIKESEELTENIMRAIQKESGENVGKLYRWVKASERVPTITRCTVVRQNNWSGTCYTDNAEALQRLCEIEVMIEFENIEWLEEYALQYQSVPISGSMKITIDELRAIISASLANEYREQGWEECENTVLQQCGEIHQYPEQRIEQIKKNWLSSFLPKKP